jgi:fucose 4-O-acetylase-like acetyltransferase
VPTIDLSSGFSDLVEWVTWRKELHLCNLCCYCFGTSYDYAWLSVNMRSQMFSTGLSI